MEQKGDVEYKGLDNRDLKLINVEEWNFPLRGRFGNPLVRTIMDRVAKMEPGEVVRTEDLDPRIVDRLRSAVWRLVRKYKMGVKVAQRGSRLYLRKEGAT